ncbi:phosphonate ABC transporter, permease protein PhnE [Roseomonas sp. E05]|uniref:phosphonate ABC transporter, permease protein PhnE n=1 Tax=Roseomonas sp. E05 TaxID=3046310 RepID=UPI0024B94F04|nr:phosphonate ABC transporter, permease protein PhnE [Roseomonas sp. E05]MDJ0389394.1 phosphonate ABC transporter, permease protein PhnE [Roseomonas sp. E05]
MSALAAHLPAVRRGEAAYQALRRRRRRATLVGLAVLAVAFLAAARISEFYPSSLAAGLPRIGEYFHRILPTLQWDALFAGTKTEGSLAFWLYRLDSWLLLLLQTAQMAALATIGGTAVALLLAFPAARNLAPSRWLHHLTRRGLEATRTVPEIVYALIFVWAFGVGPLAGILAIGLHTAGALGKLFSEVIENAPMQSWDGLRASGANWAQACRYAILPQVAPNLLSYALLRFEINLRGATVIGFVGAGGIGQELYQVIAFNYYEEISAIVVLVILSVVLIDLLSERLRHRLIHATGAR